MKGQVPPPGFAVDHPQPPFKICSLFSEPPQLRLLSPCPTSNALYPTRVRAEENEPLDRTTESDLQRILADAWPVL